VLAELSGGMDSSSIVCMSDYLNERGVDERSSVDTVSYFNDEEPNWNEKPYFLKVEERRGKAGLHIDVSPQRLLQRESGEQRIVLLPGNMRRSASSELKTWIASHGSRVLLSGTGGDEVTGGVPTPIPELQDLLALAKPTLLAQRLQAWALYQTRPWIHILGETVQGFLNTRVMRPAHRSHPRWIRREFLCRNSAAFVDGQKRIRLFGALPSFQSNLQAIEGLQRQLSCSSISSAPLLEKRYPFLDRDLLDFLFKIPREQLVRPGQRRSLLRRSLAGIVPDEILNRRRKAYVSRFPMAMMSELAFSSIDRSDDMILSRLGYVDGSKFREAIDQVRRERTAPPMALLRAAGIEEWLAVFAARDALSIDSAGRCRVNLKAGH
jgi:asparagine synthase (glutamine-hydrolysing)